MTALSVLKFNTPEGADQALGTLQGMQKQQLIQVVDAAVVKWPKGAEAPKTKQSFSTTGAGALTGTFWGMLFGLIFFMPFFGAAIGAAMGAITGAMSDYGIDDDFIKNSRDKVTEGTSALFLLSTNAVLDKVIAGLKDLHPELISSNLSAEQEAKLRAAFGDDETPETAPETAEGKATA